MAYELRHHSDVHVFAKLALPFLLKDEPTNNLQIGLTQRVLDGEPLSFEFLATVHDAAGQTVGVATLNPGHNLVLSPIPGEALAALAERVSRLETAIPGVLGPVDTVNALARFVERTVSSRTPLDIWRLDTIRPQPTTKGSCKIATLDELSLVRDWLRHFCSELSDHMPVPAPERVLRWISGANIFLCCADDCAVSMAIVARESPAGATLGYVYTPISHRARGFASCCVTAACREILARGKRFVTLYVDPKNVAASRVYKRVGFERVATTLELRFAETAPGG